MDNLVHTSGFDDRAAPGRPVTPPVRLPLATLPDRPEVTVVGYRPRFNLERGLWYVDVALDPGNAFWPFVRLAVCRYQPNSIDGCHLSAPVRCDYVQLPAERTTSVSRTDETHVRVVVSGPIGLRRHPDRGGVDTVAAAVDENRRVIARLQRRDPAIDTDLGWSTVAADRLTVRGAGDGKVAWVGELDAGTPLPLRRPGTASDWRIMWRNGKSPPTREPPVPNTEFVLQDTEFIVPDTEFIVPDTEFIVQDTEFSVRERDPAHGLAPDRARDRRLRRSGSH